MTRYLSFRNGMALFTGIVAGLLVALLPASPNRTVRLPTAEALEGDMPLKLHAISSDGRYLVTHHHHPGPDNVNGTIDVWDRDRGWHEPVIQAPAPPRCHSVRVLLSPDETQLAVFFRLQPGTEHVVLLYDLASAKLIKQWQADFHYPLFAPDGKLLVVADRVVRDLETGQDLHRFPEMIEDLTLRNDYGMYLGNFAVYRKDRFVKLYSLHTGQLQATHDLIFTSMTIHHLSRDGQVVAAAGSSPSTRVFDMLSYNVILDASTQARHEEDNLPMGRIRVLSPDGRHLAQFGRASRPAWLARWWPVNSGVKTVRLTHWSTGAELETFGNVVDAHFSPLSNQLAIVRDDGAIDVYVFPIRTPWGRIAIVALAGALMSWCAGWLWGRWRHGRPRAPREDSSRGA